MTQIRLVARRATVVAAAGLSLTIGGIAVRAASDFTASSAPLKNPPSSIKTIVQQLADEQTRAMVLQTQLNGLTGQSGDLSAALKTARGRAAADARAAKALQSRLAAARRTPPAPASGSAIAAPTAPPVHATTGASGAAGGGEKEGGDD